jgi:hypothetical protein
MVVPLKEGAGMVVPLFEGAGGRFISQVKRPPP